MEKPPKNPVEIDPEKIKDDEESHASRKRFIADHLLNLETKKVFGSGDMVTTLEGPYAEIVLKVSEVKDDGMTVVVPEPGAPPVEIPTTCLYHFEDYHDAFKMSLIKEQKGGGFDPVH